MGDTAVVPGRSLAKVGMAFQPFNFFPHLTLRENVMLAPRLLSHPRETRAQNFPSAVLNHREDETR